MNVVDRIIEDAKARYVQGDLELDAFEAEIHDALKGLDASGQEYNAWVSRHPRFIRPLFSIGYVDEPPPALRHDLEHHAFGLTEDRGSVST